MHIKIDLVQPEFSRPIALEKIPPSGMEQTLEAKENERKALAERFGLLELLKLEAKITLHPARADQAIAVTGSLIADVVQQCVITLDPLPSHIEHSFKVFYAAPELLEGGAGPSDPNEEDFEPIIEGVIDLGELVAQNLGIMLDPYPRKEGVGYIEAGFGEEKSVPGPLAQLANWPKNPKKTK